MSRPRLTLGQQVAEYRKAEGLSLRKLAQMACISHAYLHDIEEDRRFPSPDVTQALESALCCYGAYNLVAMSPTDRRLLADLVERYGLTTVRAVAGWPCAETAKDEHVMEWKPTETAPEGVLVETCIWEGPGPGVEPPRTVQTLRKQGRLWFAGDMYVYYTPTHWREMTEDDRK
jgi:transcriptional regulator with XRE-family HTH domain